MQHCKAALQLLQLELGWRGHLSGEGLLTGASDEQPKKALSPIAVTPLGMLTDASDEQPSKAPPPMRWFEYAPRTMPERWQQAWPTRTCCS